ncbi:hypothetical protein PRIPAC_80153, partial [Pristionchus pacificus]|uniref:Uncharacterized protein n=1 Tax=Pristionchus pacificus TaxID=54126 RepID=A0A2A6C237_PRIPA
VLPASVGTIFGAFLLGFCTYLGVLPIVSGIDLATQLCHTSSSLHKYHSRVSECNWAAISCIMSACRTESTYCFPNFGNTIHIFQFIFFVPVILHQIGYYMCACSFLLITIERLILCYKPGCHEKYPTSFACAFILSLLLEMSMVLPAIVILQYEEWTLFCAIFMGLQEFITFLVRGVIELTRAFIPIISLR